MLRASVAQNPTFAVNAGRKNDQNCPAFAPPAANCDGCAKIGPKPPAARYAHASSAAPMSRSNGALMLSSTRTDSMPRQAMKRLSPQKPRKQTNCGRLMPSAGNGASSAHDGMCASSAL